MLQSVVGSVDFVVKINSLHYLSQNVCITLLPTKFRQMYIRIHCNISSRCTSYSDILIRQEIMYVIFLKKILRETREIERTLLQKKIQARVYSDREALCHCRTTHMKKSICVYTWMHSSIEYLYAYIYIYTHV